MKKIKNVESTILKPTREAIKAEGRLMYCEGDGAWNLIRLKGDILKEFPQLKQRREKFDYSMVVHRTFDKLKQDLEKMEKEELLPIFLFFKKKQLD